MTTSGKGGGNSGDRAVIVKYLRPHQLGWLHRPEFDTATTTVWERPDGTLWVHERRLGEPVVPVLPRLKP